MEEIKTLEQAIAWCVEYEALVDFGCNRIVIYALEGAWLGQGHAFIEAVVAASLEWYVQSVQLVEEIAQEGEQKV